MAVQTLADKYAYGNGQAVMGGRVDGFVVDVAIGVGQVETATVAEATIGQRDIEAAGSTRFIDRNDIIFYLLILTCYLYFIICYLLVLICYLSIIVCCLFIIICYLLINDCYLLFMICSLFFFIYYLFIIL